MTHLAASLGVPVVALFGPTDPGRWAPKGKQTTVLHQAPACSPCLDPDPDACTSGKKDCLGQITPKAVLEIIDEIFVGN